MKTIFFGNLPLEADCSFLRFIVKEFGRGYNFRIIPPVHEEDFRYGFVDMNNSEADQLILYFETHDLTYFDKRIVIKYAQGEVSARSQAINKKKAKKRIAIMERRKKRLQA